jgi:hypothetical protein
MKPEKTCQNFGDQSAPPGCLCESDERYTMDFSDIGEGCIYWCSKCGPEAQAIDSALTKALDDPNFFARFKESVEKQEALRVIA